MRAWPHVAVALAGVIVLGFVGAGCTAGDEAEGTEAAETAPTTVAGHSGIADDVGGGAEEADPEPIPVDAVWVLDDPSVTLVQVEERETPLDESVVGPGVAYRRTDGVTARIAHEADTADEDVIDGGAALSLPLAGGERVTITITGATTTEAAAEVAEDVADLLGDGTQIGLGSDAAPVDHLGDLRLIGRFDPSSPVVAITTTTLRYRTADDSAVYLEQALLVDPDVSPEVAISPPAGAAATVNGQPLPVSAMDIAPSRTTIEGASRVTIVAPEDQHRPLADRLRPVARQDLDEMVLALRQRVVDRGEGEPVVDGVAFYNRADPPLACIDGAGPDGCAEITPSGPLQVAWIRQGETYLVVGCIHQPTPVDEVTVSGHRLVPRPAACGHAFTVAEVAPGTLTISFDDGPGGVGTYTYDVAS